MIHYHNGFGAPVCCDDSRCAADDCSSQRRLDAAAAVIRIFWMFLTNVLDHLRLRINIQLSDKFTFVTAHNSSVCRFQR